MNTTQRDTAARLSPVLWFRERVGLTQRELAEAVKEVESSVFDDAPKWSEQYIRRAEKGMVSSTPETLQAVGDVFSIALGDDYQSSKFRWISEVVKFAAELDYPKVLPVEKYDPNGNFWQAAYDSWVILKTLCYKPIYDRKATYKEAKDYRNALCRSMGISESRYALSEALSVNIASLDRWERVCGPRSAPSDRHDPRWPTALVERLTWLDVADSALSGGGEA